MKQRLLKSVCLLSTLFFSTPIMASMVDNQSSLTADFTRMPARTASANTSDAAIYNPAGTAWLKEGKHIGLSAKLMFKDWQHTMGNDTFDSTDPNYVAVPHGVYRQGRLGVYAGFAIFGGLGIVDYDDGFSLGSFSPIPSMGKINLTFKEKTNFTYLVPGLTTGVSWKLSDRIAVSGGVRLLYGLMEGEMGGGDILDAKAEAFGGAPVLGISWRATDKLDVSVRHEMKTKMEYEIKKISGNHPFLPLIKTLIDEGDKIRRDFPAETALGIMYHVNNKLRVAADGVIAWQKNANRGGEEEGMGNGYYIATAVEYDVNQKWTLSGGHIYCDPKDDRERFPYLTVNPKLEYHAISAGVKYNYSDALSMCLAVAPYFYDDYTIKNSDIKMEKDTIEISFGLEWSFD